MINYVVIDRFIDPQVGRRLIQDLENFSDKPTVRYQGGRRIMPNTSEAYRKLLDSSESWRVLNTRLTSDSFLSSIFDRLGLEASRFSKTRYFYRCASLFDFLTKYGSRPLKNNNPGIVFIWGMYSLIVLLLSKIMARVLKIFGCQLGELLFDVSSAGNGYSREIHRDSDARVFVFLLYLNDLEVEAGCTGGELLLHNYEGDEQGDPPPQPPFDQTSILEEVQPKSGRLLIFENNRYSYHSVRKMSGFSGERFFCYGSFTLLSGRNNSFSGSRYRLPTDFKMYL